MKDIRCFKCHKTVRKRAFYGLHARCFVDWFHISEDIFFSNLDPKKSTSTGISTKYLIKDSFYHGRYRKYSAKLGNAQYILKMQEALYPDLPAMEYLCNKIATLLNLKIPEYYLIRWPESKKQSNKITQKVEYGVITFVTKNFMQKYPIGILHHIYKFLPKGGEHYNCRNIIKVIMEQTNKPLEVKKFIEICLFDSFIGNNDRHGRNLAIIDTGKKRFLAPMYDNPSRLAVETEDMLNSQFNISGSIWTSSSNEPKIKDYIQEFKKLNKVEYTNTCFKFIKKTIFQFSKIVREIKHSEISEKRKEAFIRFLNDRLKDLKQVLKEVEKDV